MNILVIAAHPDDEILGMGGTIAKYTKNGDVVKIVIMATGITSRRSDNLKNKTKYKISKKTEQNMYEQIKELRKNAIKAAKIIGVKDIEFMEFPDNEMDLVSNLEITKKIEEVINEFDPTIVYTHSSNDVNIDHKMIYNATITATRPSKNSRVEKVITFEIPSSTEWTFSSDFSPNIFVNIEKELSKKIKALEAYKSEIREFPHPRSIEALKMIAGRWGSVSGFNAAEAFCLIRELRKQL